MSPQDADPFDPGPPPPRVNGYDVVGWVAAAILAWLTLAMWRGWI